MNRMSKEKIVGKTGVLIIDDTIGIEVFTKEQKEKLSKIFNEFFISRINKSHARIFIQSRLHDYDVAGEILKTCNVENKECKMMLPNDAINKAYDEYLENIKSEDKFDKKNRISIYCKCGKNITSYFDDLTNDELEDALENDDVTKLCGGQFCLP